MADFTAKTRDEMHGNSPAMQGKPGDNKVPSMDIDHFGFAGDAGSTMHRKFVYASRKHSLTDVCKPGYFNAAREFGVKNWDIIEITLGDDPATAMERTLRVIDALHKDQPIVVALKQPNGHFVPCRHDGTLGETKEAA